MQTGIPHIILLIAGAVLTLAMVFTLVRLIRGPGTGDRIVSLDLVASIIMGFILLYSLQSDDPVYFDIAIVISLVSFMGTVAISIYLSRKK